MYFCANVMFFIMKDSILYIVLYVTVFKIKKHLNCFQNTEHMIFLLSVNITFKYNFKWLSYRINIINFSYIHIFLYPFNKKEFALS